MFSAITLDHHSHLTLQNVVVSKCTTYCNIKKLYTLPTHCFAMFHMILRTVITSINSFSRPSHEDCGLCEASVVQINLSVQKDNKTWPHSCHSLITPKVICGVLLKSSWFEVLTVVLLLLECDAALLDKQFLHITLQYLLHQAWAAQEDCFLKISLVTCPVTL